MNTTVRITLKLIPDCAAKEPIAIVFFDADHLKYVNDRFDHDMGNVSGEKEA